MLQSYRFLSERRVNIVRAPFSGGQGKGGVEAGPQMLIDAGLPKQIERGGWQVSLPEALNIESLRPPIVEQAVGKMRNVKFVAEAARMVAQACEASAKSGALTLTLGGDHSLGIGTIAGALAARPDTVVLWIDAHADLNTPESTESGNLHGCPLSFLLGLAGTPESLPEPLRWIPAALKAHRLAYIGLRDIDPEERRLIREHGIAAYSMHHIDRDGIGAVVRAALDRINPDRTRPIHLSYDVDALDPVFVSATGTPVRGGLTFREGTFICEAVAETGCLVSMDVVEVNPSLAAVAAQERGDTDNRIAEIELRKTVEIANALVRCALGETLL
ncbi:Arginase, catabolizes arginine to ornithine and urea [Savitreella phatthalungensis]